MVKLQQHLRSTFLAGIFGAIPIVVTIFLIWYVDDQTRVISEKLFGKRLPVVGVVIAIVGIYVFGLIATSLLGKFFIRAIDGLLSRVPILKQVYAAWKQVALTPGGTEGTFAKMVLIPSETAKMHTLGFTSGLPIAGSTDTLCVFVPAAPNPLQGRLFFVHRDQCRFLEASNEEGFKLLLSTGNYVPAEFGEVLEREYTSKAAPLQL
jgi:uncharacterized membrane protein